MFKILRQFLPFFLLGIVLFSCIQEENIEANAPNEQEPVEQSKHFVSTKEASDLAAAIEFPTQEGSQLRARGVTNSAKEVESITPMPDDRGNTSYYIINYAGGGFLILSADKRTPPFLAYSESNEFPVDMEEYPSGLGDWLVETKYRITDIRQTVQEPNEKIARSWQPMNIQRFIGPPVGGGSKIGPFLKLKWHQGDGFNDKAPSGGCAPISTTFIQRDKKNTHMLAGCVAVAMGQVMKYYRYSSRGNYKWGDYSYGMPRTYGSEEISRLLKDIGDAVNMTYQCFYSTAFTKDVKGVFKTFGYSCSYPADYNLKTVKNNLKKRRPVILVGGGYKYNLFDTPLGRYSHMWICDGYDYIYGDDFLYMVWGFYNGHGNAWYIHDDWYLQYNGKKKTNYGLNKKMIYDIVPNR